MLLYVRLQLASERGRNFVELGREGGKYSLPKNCVIYIVAILNEPITTQAKNKRYSLIITRTMGVANGCQFRCLRLRVKTVRIE